MYGVKLGKVHSPFLPTMPRLSQHVKLSTWLPDPVVAYAAGINNYGMLGNDNAGDCVEAAAAHASQIWTKGNTVPYTGMITPQDKDVLALYSKITGYNPANAFSDTGTVPTAMFQMWSTTPLFGCKMLACASVALENWLNLMFAISKFGGVFFGWVLPQSVQGKTVWDVSANDGGVWGGHETFGCGYDDSTGELTVISWGQLITVKHAFWIRYCNEQHVVLSDVGEGLLSRGATGLDVDGLKSQLAGLTV